MKYPITKPYIGDAEKELVQKPLETGWVVQGPYVEKFENKFSDFITSPLNHSITQSLNHSYHSIASTSCTTALHLAVRALGVEEGDEVIVPAFTWVSTANVVEYENARPVFCDINPRTFNIDLDQIEQHITARTVGVIPVHLFGLCAEMEPIMQLADEHDLWVLEDAACGLGARINGQHAGTFGAAGCFSFHPRKSITTGEGGMVTTESEEIEKHCRSLRDHGATRTDLERHEEEKGFLLPDYPDLGYNYRMTDLQGAVGCAQLEKADYILEERRKIARRYDKLLEDIDWMQAPYVPEDYAHGYQSYVTTFLPETLREEVKKLRSEEAKDQASSPHHLITSSLNNGSLNHIIGQIDGANKKRNELMTSLEEEGIATRQGTHTAALQDYYRDKYDTSPADYLNSYFAEQLSISLPIYVGLEPADQENIIETMVEVKESIS